MSATSPLELEHVIGWTGAYPQTLCLHPTEETTFFSALGASVVIGDVYDPHKQRFLRAHDADVTALDVSSTGRLCASGQRRSALIATGDATVHVWEVARGSIVYTLFGLTEAVQIISFSPDERFLVAASADNTIAIWDMLSGEQVYAKRQGTGGGSTKGIHFLAWGPVTSSPASKRPAYTLAFTVFDRVHVASLEYDFRSMRYAVVSVPAALPASGFTRAYAAGAFDATGRMILAGTSAGELAVYTLQAAPAPVGAPATHTATPLFKTALVAAGNGVHAVRPVRAPIDASGRAAVFLGGGDGSLRCFMGRDADWVCTAEARLPDRVVSVSLAASAGWLLVGTAAGGIFRVAWAVTGGAPAPISLAGGAVPPRGAALSAYADLLEASHTAAVTAVATHPATPEVFITAGSDATLRLWSLNDYRTSWECKAASAGPHATVVWVAPDVAGAYVDGAKAGGVPAEVYAGFDDGTLRAFSVRERGSEVAASAGGRAPSETWRSTAHRGGVTAITGNRAVVVTGGGDGKVLVWSRASRERVLAFADHSRPVVGLAVDNASPEIIYSAGADRAVLMYNLRAERRLRSHALPAAEAHACTLTALVQLAAVPGSERELLAATSDGRIFLFDPDVPDTHAGATDVLALLAEFRARSGVAVDLPLQKPGQARPELRITALAASPSARYVAIGTACGRLIVLSIPALVAAAAGTAPSFRGPVNAGTYTDASGHVRPALVSQASVMKVVAFFFGRAHYASIAWSVDERQIIAVSSDACISVFNWFGA